MLSRERVTTVEAADRLFHMCVNVEDVWRQVKRLPPFAAPQLIGCCEMMFVRLALAQFVLQRTQPPAVSECICNNMTRLTAGALTGQGDELTRRFYAGPLEGAAEAAIGAYRQMAPAPLRIAAAMMQRLQGPPYSPGPVSIELNRYGNQISAGVHSLQIR
jgi:hypothetical protein